MGKKENEGREEHVAEDELDANVATEDGQEAHSEPEDELDQLRRENLELKQQWARAQADYQNQKRRAQADYEAGVRRTLQPFLADLLQVLDYLDMALASPTTTDEAKNLALGVEMTRGQFLQALAQQGVQPVRTEGVFDPALHEATAAEVREDVPAGTILSVVRKGYRRGDEVLRFAHVVVARGEGEDVAEVVDAG